MYITIILEGTMLKNDEVDDLIKKTILLLEKTKKQYKTYEQERRNLYSYLVNKNDVEQWKKCIEQLEEIMRWNK